MKYMIEFELPDNDTVLREIKTADVAWGIWGYRGYTKAKPVQRWIPCSERLPFDAGYYLTTTIYNEVFCDYWNLNEWNRMEQVIAWMYMPEPYKGDDK